MKTDNAKAICDISCCIPISFNLSNSLLDNNYVYYFMCQGWTMELSYQRGGPTHWNLCTDRNLGMCPRQELHPRLLSPQANILSTEPNWLELITIFLQYMFWLYLQKEKLDLVPFHRNIFFETIICLLFVTFFKLYFSHPILWNHVTFAQARLYAVG